MGQLLLGDGESLRISIEGEPGEEVKGPGGNFFAAAGPPRGVSRPRHGPARALLGAPGGGVRRGGRLAVIVV